MIRNQDTYQLYKQHISKKNQKSETSLLLSSSSWWSNREKSFSPLLDFSGDPTSCWSISHWIRRLVEEEIFKEK